MSFLEKNLAILNKVLPAQAAKLQGNLASSPLLVSLSLKEGQIAWESNGVTGNFPDSDSGLNTVNDEQHLVVLYGVGDGRYLDKIRKLKDVFHILVFEPSITLFRDLLTQKDFTDVIQDEKVSFILGADKRLFLNEIDAYFSSNALHYYYAGYFANLASPGIQRIPDYQKSVLDFAEIFRTGINNYTQKIRGEPPEDAFRGFMNATRNAKTFLDFPVVRDFRDAFKGLPGILVGSGPSLEFSLPYLREVQDKAVIFACDSTLKILLQNGIKPHFTGVLERSHMQADLFTGMSPEEHEAILIVPPIVHPRVLETYQGKKFAIHRNVGFDSWLFPQEERFYLGRFVSHLGLCALAILGCSEICLVGMDSSYAPQKPGQSFDQSVYGNLATDHMKKMANEVLEPFVVDRINFEIPGYDGKPRTTHYYWYTFANTYGEILSDFHITNAKNVMPLDHGIPIAGTTRVDPDYLRQLACVSVSDRINKFETRFDQSKPRPYDHNATIKKSYSALTDIIRVCRQQTNALSQFYADNDPSLKHCEPMYKPYFQQIELARHQIMTLHDDTFMKTLLPFIQNSHALMEHNLRKVFTTYKNRFQVLEAQLNLYIGWFNDVAIWSGRLQQYLSDIGYANDE